jgi:YD repeat-containing protein
MKRLIKKILREEFEYKQQLFDLLRSGDEMVKMVSQGQDINILELLIEYFKQVGPPYFKILKHFDLSEEELNYVLSVIFGEPVTSIVRGFNMTFRIYNKKNYEIYWEDSDGYWWKREYDENGNLLYEENSYGYWTKYEYDDRGNLIYEKDSDGFWYRKEYDKNGNLIYYENSYGYIEDKR